MDISLFIAMGLIMVTIYAPIHFIFSGEPLWITNLFRKNNLYRVHGNTTDELVSNVTVFIKVYGGKVKKPLHMHGFRMCVIMIKLGKD